MENVLCVFKTVGPIPNKTFIRNIQPIIISLIVHRSARSSFLVPESSFNFQVGRHIKAV